MTTQTEIDEAKKQLEAIETQEKLDNEYAVLHERLEAKRKQKPPQDIGGQMRWILDQYNLRTSFYCFIFGMTIILIGLLTPYSLAAGIPGALFFFNAGPVLLFLYGVWSIPIVKEFLSDEIKSRSKK